MDSDYGLIIRFVVYFVSLVVVFVAVIDTID